MKKSIFVLSCLLSISSVAFASEFYIGRNPQQHRSRNRREARRSTAEAKAHLQSKANAATATTAKVSALASSSTSANSSSSKKMKEELDLSWCRNKYKIVFEIDEGRIYWKVKGKFAPGFRPADSSSDSWEMQNWAPFAKQRDAIQEELAETIRLCIFTPNGDPFTSTFPDQRSVTAFWNITQRQAKEHIKKRNRRVNHKEEIDIDTNPQ